MHRGVFRVTVNMKTFSLEGFAGDQLKQRSATLVRGGVVGGCAA